MEVRVEGKSGRVVKNVDEVLRRESSTDYIAFGIDKVLLPNPAPHPGSSRSRHVEWERASGE